MVIQHGEWEVFFVADFHFSFPVRRYTLSFLIPSLFKKGLYDTYIERQKREGKKAAHTSARPYIHVYMCVYIYLYNVCTRARDCACVYLKMTPHVPYLLTNPTGSPRYSLPFGSSLSAYNILIYDMFCYFLAAVAVRNRPTVVFYLNLYFFSFQKLYPSSLPLFDVDEISINEPGTLCALVGTKGVSVMRFPKRIGPRSLYDGEGGTTVQGVTCR